MGLSEAILIIIRITRHTNIIMGGRTYWYNIVVSREFAFFLSLSSTHPSPFLLLINPLGKHA
jgi:hypothetical protein